MTRALIACLIFAGCGARGGPGLVRMKQKVDELAQAQAASDRRIEDLHNRIFLLEDRVETSRVAAQRRGDTPRLPVIRLRPTADGRVEETARPLAAADGDPEPPLEDHPLEEPASGELAPGEQAPRPSSVVEDVSVSFRGAAGRTSETRPVLRLHGASARRRPDRDAAAPLPGPDPASVTESLGVVPLPSGQVSRAAARDVRPMRDYKSALSLYRAGKHSDAAEAFRTFVKRHARHEYADNALYWLAECQYDMKDFRLALKTFRRVVEEYPTGNKAPDALLKMGFTYLKLKDKGNARTVLAQLVESFPKSQVARLASETLVRIR